MRARASQQSLVTSLSSILHLPSSTTHCCPPAVRIRAHACNRVSRTSPSPPCSCLCGAPPGDAIAVTRPGELDAVPNLPLRFTTPGPELLLALTGPDGGVGAVPQELQPPGGACERAPAAGCPPRDRPNVPAQHAAALVSPPPQRLASRGSSLRPCWGSFEQQQHPCPQRAQWRARARAHHHHRRCPLERRPAAAGGRPHPCTAPLLAAAAAAAP